MFILPEIIFNPSLILNLHITLLSLIFADNAFLALSLILAKRISKLNIPLSYKQLPLDFKPEIVISPSFISLLRRFIAKRSRPTSYCYIRLS